MTKNYKSGSFRKYAASIIAAAMLAFGGSSYANSSTNAPVNPSASSLNNSSTNSSNAKSKSGLFTSVEVGAYNNGLGVSPALVYRGETYGANASLDYSSDAVGGSLGLEMFTKGQSQLFANLHMSDKYTGADAGVAYPLVSRKNNERFGLDVILGGYMFDIKDSEKSSGAMVGLEGRYLLTKKLGGIDAFASAMYVSDDKAFDGNCIYGVGLRTFLGGRRPVRGLKPSYLKIQEKENVKPTEPSVVERPSYGSPAAQPVTPVQPSNPGPTPPTPPVPPTPVPITGDEGDGNPVGGKKIK